MRIKFNPNLEYQQDAIAAVRDIFDGQQTCTSDITVDAGDLRLTLEGQAHDFGASNRLRLHGEDIARNVNRIQIRNGLAPTRPLDGMNFTVEMETGTGKTYVYLRTIFELNREYGFTKFIVVVPSVAIKEGVFKTLRMTEDHFKGLYANVRFDYFVYDSLKLGRVRNFADSDYIQIMVINIDAFRRSFTDPTKEDRANVIHRPHDGMTGCRPIEFIQGTNPIVFIDEPQSVDTTKKSKEAIESLNPLCTIRYSATHIQKYNMVFRLDSIDAYQRELVKQIEVAGIEFEDSHNKAYVKLLEVDNANNHHKARIELDVLARGGEVRRKLRTVRPGDDLVRISGGRDVYDGYVIEDIYCKAGDEHVRFTRQAEVLRPSVAIGQIDDDQCKRLQIRKTIEEHLAKELVLCPQGLKVLSLFFIDRVAHYRTYDDQGRPRPGKYAVMFEEEYVAAIGKPEFSPLLEGAEPVEVVDGVHNGYFAVDAKRDSNGNGMLKESRGHGTTQADENAYQLIMRDKEKLLSFESKLKFIFTHSALREGWDNPNVFQICTLNETTSVVKKRQEIGRGLRIAVNQLGERVFGHDVNRLTVMANESYEQFASQLQKEIEEDTGFKFGVVEKHLFAGLHACGLDDDTASLGIEASHRIWDQLKAIGYIDQHGSVQDELRMALKQKNVILPDECQKHARAILQLLGKVAGSVRIKNANGRHKTDVDDKDSLGPERRRLLRQITSQSTFRVDFDSQRLIAQCADEIEKMPALERARYTYQKALATIERGGVQAQSTQSSTHDLDASDLPLPDIVSYLQKATKLTRRSIVEILIRCRRLQDFKNNPQKFIERVATIVARQMQSFIGDGVRYREVRGRDGYVQELCRVTELYDRVGREERNRERADVQSLANELELRDDVRLCVRLPADFKVDTPLGIYRPDWAILLDVDGAGYLYFLRDSC